MDVETDAVAGPVDERISPTGIRNDRPARRVNLAGGDTSPDSFPAIALGLQDHVKDTARFWAWFTDRHGSRHI